MVKSRATKGNGRAPPLVGIPYNGYINPPKILCMTIPYHRQIPGKMVGVEFLFDPIIFLAHSSGQIIIFHQPRFP